MTLSQAWLLYVAAALIGWLCWNAMFAWMTRFPLSRRLIYALGATILFTPGPIAPEPLADGQVLYAPAAFPLILTTLTESFAATHYLWPWLLASLLIWLVLMALYHVIKTRWQQRFAKSDGDQNAQVS